MQNRNPYAPPRANVARIDSDEEYGEISGIVAAVAIPAYQDYVLRAQSGQQQ